jgi:hypothetical protein
VIDVDDDSDEHPVALLPSSVEDVIPDHDDIEGHFGSES